MSSQTSFVLVRSTNLLRRSLSCPPMTDAACRMSAATLRSLNFHLLSPSRFLFSGRTTTPKNYLTWFAFYRYTQRLCGQFNEKIVALSGIFARQCHAIIAQRIRRSAQIVALYGNLGYDSRILQTVFAKIGRALLKKGRDRPFFLLWGTAIFAWEKDKISEDEIYKVAEEVNHVHLNSSGQVIVESQLMDVWENIIDKGHFCVWRRPVPNSYLYEYKVFGTIHDLPARAFYFAQTDLEFRKKWDKLVISLDVIDREDESGSEVVHWITHFPYPMYSRDYVFVRKCKVDNDKRVMVIVNRSIDHPARPASPKYVRVNTYMSQMVIKPHSNFDENGFDYVLTYYDDPKAAFPKFAYSWMATTGVPDYVDKVHTAAKLLYEQRHNGITTTDQDNTDDSQRVPM